jgi:hypothetical protein
MNIYTPIESERWLFFWVERAFPLEMESFVD